MSIDFFERMIFSKVVMSENSCTFMALDAIVFKGSFMSKAIARVVKLVDTRDLKSLGIIYRAGSTPALGTRFKFGKITADDIVRSRCFSKPLT